MNDLKVDFTNLSEEEKQQLLKLVKKSQKSNPFGVKENERAYYNIERYGTDYGIEWDKDDRKVYIPCKDKSIVMARQKRHHLEDLLEKFAWGNDSVVTDEMWEDAYLFKYFVYYDKNFNKFHVGGSYTSKDFSTTYFKSEKVAERAIEEVVIPFMKGENK